MNSIKVFTILFFLIFISSNSYSQENELVKYKENGLFTSVGSSFGVGSDALKYVKSKLNSMAEIGLYYKAPLSNIKYSYKVEYSARFINTPIKFADNIPGVANQNVQSLNIKFGRNFCELKDYSFEVFMGTGVYTLAQKRIYDPVFSNQTLINDGFGAYWGINAEFEISASIPVNKGRMGLATRLFIQPPFAIASKSNVPKYYNQGFMISWFFAFGK